jgi:hypothetical protein
MLLEIIHGLPKKKIKTKKENRRKILFLGKNEFHLGSHYSLIIEVRPWYIFYHSPSFLCDMLQLQSSSNQNWKFKSTVLEWSEGLTVVSSFEPKNSVILKEYEQKQLENHYVYLAGIFWLLLLFWSRYSVWCWLLTCRRVLLLFCNQLLQNYITHSSMVGA